MGMWEILEEGRGEYDRDFGMRSGNPMEEAYKEGFRHGYEKAMREMQGGEIGYRNSGGSRGGSYSGGSDMSERRSRLLPGISDLQRTPQRTALWRRYERT